MKILELAPYVFVEGHRYGSRNQSGLAYMVRSICDMLATQNDVHVLTQSILTKKKKVNGWTLVRRNISTCLFHIKPCYIWLAIRLYYTDKSIRFAKLLFYCLSAGQVESYIRKWRPNVVHIHGISSIVMPYYFAAIRCGVPIMSTLHGLLSYSTIVPATDSHKLMERRFLKLCINNNYSLSVISSGMKRKVQNTFGVECSNITVIPNCFRGTVNCNRAQEWDYSHKRIVCVGGLSPLKNQIQVIRVLPIIQEHFRGRYPVILDLFGDGQKRDEWETFCIENHISGVIFHGRQPQIEIYKAISKSDLLVFPSIEEGFGIPIIEAYSCGTPVVAFSDIDAAADIANESCCVLSESRSDESLIKAIVLALNKNWDKKMIKDFSHSFSMDSISLRYNMFANIQHRAWKKEDIHSLL